MLWSSVSSIDPRYLGVSVRAWSCHDPANDILSSCRVFVDASVTLAMLQYVPWACESLPHLGRDVSVLNPSSVQCSLVCEPMHYPKCDGQSFQSSPCSR